MKIKLKSEAVKSLINTEIPIAVESRWMEHLNGTETGEYRLTTQGAIIGELTYFRKRDGKNFSFYDDKDLYGLSGCIWNGLSGCIWEQLTKFPDQNLLNTHSSHGLLSHTHFNLPRQHHASFTANISAIMLTAISGGVMLPIQMPIGPHSRTSDSAVCPKCATIHSRREAAYRREPIAATQNASLYSASNNARSPSSTA